MGWKSDDPLNNAVFSFTGDTGAVGFAPNSDVEVDVGWTPKRGFAGATGSVLSGALLTRPNKSPEADGAVVGVNAPGCVDGMPKGFASDLGAESHIPRPIEGALEDGGSEDWADGKVIREPRSPLGLPNKSDFGCEEVSKRDLAGL